MRFGATGDSAARRVSSGWRLICRPNPRKAILQFSRALKIMPQTRAPRLRARDRSRRTESASAIPAFILPLHRFSHGGPGSAGMDHDPGYRCPRFHRGVPRLDLLRRHRLPGTARHGIHAGARTIRRRWHGSNRRTGFQSAHQVEMGPVDDAKAAKQKSVSLRLALTPCKSAGGSFGWVL
jgi:hypothetical protein